MVDQTVEIVPRKLLINKSNELYLTELRSSRGSLYVCVVCTGGGGEQRFTGRPGSGAQRQQQYRPQMPRQNSMEGVASMEQDDNSNDGVIMVR